MSFVSHATEHTYVCCIDRSLELDVVLTRVSRYLRNADATLVSLGMSGRVGDEAVGQLLTWIEEGYPTEAFSIECDEQIRLFKTVVFTFYATDFLGVGTENEDSRALAPVDGRIVYGRNFLLDPK